MYAVEPHVMFEGSDREDVGDALVRLAERFGTDTFFGVVSIHNQPIIDRLAASARYVPVRHEASAINAADAYSRVTGKLGVAITSTGTGAGNAAGSLIEAHTAGSQVLHITGQIETAFLGQGRGVIHETKNQLGMLESVSKFAATASTTEELGTLLIEAAQQAIAPPSGPVSIEIPIDIQYGKVSLPAESNIPSPPILEDEIEAAADLIADSQQPAIWIGGGAVGSEVEVRQLAERLGAAVFTSAAGRGVIDEREDFVIGNFASSEQGASLLAEADLLISIGTHHRSNETKHYQLKFPERHIQIDIDPRAIARSYPVTLGIIGTAKAAVSGLIPAIGERSVNTVWLETVKASGRAARQKIANDIGPYLGLCDSLRKHLPVPSPFVRDVTIAASSWGNRLFPIYDASTNVNPRGGGIGQGLAMGLGAAIARPDLPTLLLVGDGGLALQTGELGSIAQENPWLVTVLFNDGGYGVLRNLQDQHFDRRAGVDLVTPDFELLARSFEIDYYLIADSDDVDRVVSEAFSLGRPVIIEVDCNDFGTMNSPFVPPIPLPI